MIKTKKGLPNKFFIEIRSFKAVKLPFISLVRLTYDRNYCIEQSLLQILVILAVYKR